MPGTTDPIGPASQALPVSGPPALVELWPAPTAGDGVHALDRPRVLGRMGGGDLELGDTTVSRRHARVARVAAGLSISDLGSRNGTRLNGEPLAGTAPLAPGDLVVLGSTVLLCVDDAAMFAGWRAGAGDALVGGPAIAAIRSLVARFAPTALPVLVQGETGCGKELVAQAVHATSGRRGALVPVNCAAVPAALFEAELFGARRGAFTGADRDRPGLMRSAHGGTLLLDEVGELPPDCQAKLLRAVETRHVQPLGAPAPEPVDARIIAATNRALDDDVAAGRFRRDLFERLAGVVVWIPPLRDRPEDVALLCEHFARRQAGELGANVAVGADAVEAACLYDWPGNVRELERVIRRAVVDAHGAGRNAIALSLPRSRAEAAGALGRVERALRAHGGNVARAAKALGLHRAQLYDLLRRHGRDPSDYRDAP